MRSRFVSQFLACYQRHSLGLKRDYTSKVRALAEEIFHRSQGSSLLHSFQWRSKGGLRVLQFGTLHSCRAFSQASGGASLSSGISESARRQLLWWTSGLAVWVFSMVVLGGVTRLTRSGLSMTDWKFTGEKFPVTDEDWRNEFAKYKQSPEYKKVHRSMTLDQFKFIFFMEYAHRMWGRILGLLFAGPAVYFAARGYINGPLARRFALLFGMGATQGLVGWWMVRSGLEEPANEHVVPRVSPYRLAAHLLSAFSIYSILVWTSLDLARPSPELARTTPNIRFAAGRMRGVVMPIAALIGIAATSGAFVAGLDAGHAYNTFPLMAGQWIPDEYWALPGLANFFENTAAVQFNHRALAVSVLTAVGGLWLWSRRLGALPPRASTLVTALASVTALQVALGITTLLLYVPPTLGAAHQANALVLLTLVLSLLHELRPPYVTNGSRMIGRLGVPLGLAATFGVGYAVVANK